ncbi:hypothetical protein [Lactiplantibacillus plantarum]|uniref:hypothetical protein n=1 Tax=Lactiplantibacillus plantarum TaxID=1590 RepID=UPI002EDAB0DF|nr:hypothetical protein [Lactiplantibacillus plantarum]MCG0816993.1 hypothetical protein [Lactiplantibacillus plantarum]MCG0842080.1 hypothetical protein [Lactiplantibacillus plantarum]MCG0939173.1 hypothetical protein [Lactiplantibacillus plantarum]MCG0948764.1 hypothetical protein [Lactiplantibacillus plantarum]
MEVSHTLDGYWVISGYLSETPSESAQAMMRRVKEQFIKANLLLDPAKVVTVNGEFKQPIYQADKYESNDESNDGLVRVIANGKTTYIHTT